MLRGNAGDRALPNEADVCSGRLRLVDQLVELVEPGLRCPVRLASRVLAQDSEQPAGLGERLSRGGGDRLRGGRRRPRRAPARSVVQPRSRWRSPTDDARRCRGALGRCGRAPPSRSARARSRPSPPRSRRAPRPPVCVCAPTRRRRARRGRRAAERCFPARCRGQWSRTTVTTRNGMSSGAATRRPRRITRCATRNRVMHMLTTVSAGFSARKNVMVSSVAPAAASAGRDRHSTIGTRVSTLNTITPIC